MQAHFQCASTSDEFTVIIDGYLYIEEDDELYVWDKNYYIIIMRNGADNSYTIWNDRQERFKELFDYTLPIVTKIHVYVGSRILKEYIRDIAPVP
jgi:hypothetical protein